MFEPWVAVAGPRLHRTAYLLTGDWATAQDLAQYVCVETWSKWRHVDSPDAFASVVMTRAVSKWWRRRWRGDVRVDAASDRLHDGWMSVDRRVALMQALATLPPRQRSVLVLRFFEDLTEAQVAAALGCPIGTVKSTAHRALKALRSSGLVNDFELETADE